VRSDFVTDYNSEIGRQDDDGLDNSAVPPAALTELEIGLRYSLRWATIPEPARSQLRENVAARRRAEGGAV
jgi:hypothetical protein